MTTIVAPPSNASKWQMGFNSAFKGLNSERSAAESLRNKIYRSSEMTTNTLQVQKT